MDFIIDEMKASDWEQVKNIYEEGIKTELSTFQYDLPNWEEWNNGHLLQCRLVARLEDKVLGWVALSPTSSREVYSGVVSVSIYIAEAARGKGIGTTILKELIRQSEQMGIWTLQSGVIRENIASYNLHKSCGFREIGFREKVGKMRNGKWHDVVLMERRSKVAGV